MEEKDWIAFMNKMEPLLEKWTLRLPVGTAREEAKQIARIACWSKLLSYDPERGASLTTYMFMVVRSALNAWFKREYRYHSHHCFPALPSEDELSWEELIPGEDTDALEEDMLWKAWMAPLSSHEAQCITLHIRYGYSLVEVAKIMGAPYERVKKWNQRSLVKLRTYARRLGIDTN
ncbi:sigma-70 family RNA polymerase sigma factor [Aneurinibacillus terranovensis]|uniref:sigma-70 family RNA polymerase sigma factor n=1 Tax=Aneurinibacillus terranovensis TaxID=278991 RepID=UPI000428BDEC|nr:sigma-70 family RNA polymerase sigma factor [Aneurinibacillus terranovensis]